VGGLCELSFTAVPVVDGQQHVLGMVHEVDLLQRGAETPVPAGLPRAREPAEQAVLLAQLGQRQEPVAAVMRREVVPIAPDTSIRTAAHRMLTHEVKQVPVVDAAGGLGGGVPPLHLPPRARRGPPPPPAPTPHVLPAP